MPDAGLALTRVYQLGPYLLVSLAAVLLVACSIVQASTYVQASKADRRGDYSAAAKLYSTVASSEDYEFRQAAQFRLAEMHLDGLGVQKDPGAALSLLKRATEGPDSQWRSLANGRLGLLHEQGLPDQLQQDRRAAAQYYTRSASDGSKPSKASLARLTKYPDVFISLNENEFRHQRPSSAPAGMTAAYDAFTVGRYGDAFNIFIWHARNGNAEAQAAVAVLYKDGLHIAADPQRYAAWTYLAAYNGNRRAQLELGLLHRKSDLVPIDDQEAERWLQAASRQGLADATNELGVLSLHPFDDRRQRDANKALQYFRTAAAAGSAFAMSNLGDVYLNGIGVAKDPGRAKDYYLAAAQHGNLIGRQRLLEHFNIAYRSPADEKKSAEQSSAAQSPAAPPSAVPTPKSDPPLTAIEIYTALSKTVIRLFAIKVDKTTDVSQGSAVAVTKHMAITNCHVLKGKDAYGARLPSGITLFTGAGGDTARDVCLIKTDGELTAVTGTRRYGDLRIGERVYAIGSPRGLENTLSEGIISGLRTIDGTRYIQITAPITHGSSGGGLFDERGRLLGVTTLGAQSGNLNFAVAIDEALPLLETAK